jgi:hypothetical protein
MIIGVKGEGAFHSYDFDISRGDFDRYRAHLAEKIYPGCSEECEAAIRESRAPSLAPFKSHFRDGEYLFLTCPYKTKFGPEQCFDIKTDIDDYDVPDIGIMTSAISIHRHFLDILNYCSLGAYGIRLIA